MKAKNRILEISNQNEVYWLQPENILYVEADGNYCDIHLTDGDVLKTISCQRAEIARMIEMQLAGDLSSMFSLVGKSYLVNLEHIMYINAPRQILMTDINQMGKSVKKSVKASTEALRKLRQAMQEQPSSKMVNAKVCGNVRGGFSDYLKARETARDYEIGEDDIMLLGR